MCKNKLKTNASLAGTFSSREPGPWASLVKSPGYFYGDLVCFELCHLNLSSQGCSACRDTLISFVIGYSVNVRQSGTPLTWNCMCQDLRVASDCQAGQHLPYPPVQTWTSLFLPPGTAVHILPYFDSLAVSCVTWGLTGHEKPFQNVT